MSTNAKVIRDGKVRPSRIIKIPDGQVKAGRKNGSLFFYKL